MNTTIKTLVLAGWFAGSVVARGAAAAHAAPNPVPQETKEQRDTRMAWWNEARFGMFIHFGLYSVPGGVWNGKPITFYAEWMQATADIPAKDYAPLLSQFNPTNFNADAIVRTAKQAGMKYLVITTKHHDGFCLWPTKQQSDWNVAAAPFKRDIIGELAAACKKHGIRFGTYYSITDWHHPTQFIPRDANGKASTGAYFQTRLHEGRKAEYVAYMKAQIAELVKNYDTDILWFDADWVNWWTLDDGKDLYNYIRALKPSIIINNRVAKRDRFKLDFGTPENETPGTALDHAWEACWTINHSWGFKSHDHSWKSTTELIRKLVDIASKGGNLLLNVGPTGDGIIPQPSVERLAEVGKWLDVNGEAIYGTTASPFTKLMWGRCTTKENKAGTTLYLHVFNWPKDGKLTVPGLKNTVSSARLLATGKKLKFERKGEDVLLSLPATAPDANVSVIKMEIQGAPDVVQMIALKGAITASSTWSAPGHAAAKAGDADIRTRWSAAEGARSGWLEINLGTEKRVGRAFILETYSPRTEEFALEYLEGDTWKEAFRGATIAGEKLITFTPVTASRFRLNILKASDVPTIEEFTLYAN
jgi:alpha-L-fucosidase